MKIDSEIARRVYMEDPLAWWTRYGNILDKDGNEVCPPVSNFLQREVTRAIRFLRGEGRPVRLIVLKPRQRGSSTYSTACIYHECRRKTTRATIIGGQYSQVANLWRITSRYASRDRFNWGFECSVSAEKIEFGNGSYLDRETARDEDAGRSGTIQALVVTELGRWKEGLSISPTRVLAGILACVPNRPDTMVILESTPNGMQGPFYERWQEARTIEQAERGDWGSGYIRVFCPWYAFEDARLGIDEDAAAELERTLDEKELALRRLHGVSLEQLAWRRATIASELGGDAELFDQEYPTDDVSAFLGSGRLRFPAEHIQRQREQVVLQRNAALGTLDEQPGRLGGPVFRGADGVDWWFMQWEAPLVRRKYLVVVDTATGEQHQAADDPDRHAVLVLRAGYRDETGWHPPAVVGRVKTPCFVALDVLAEWVRLISAYYGNCLAVVEANNSGMALIELLKPMGVPLYERQTWNQRENRKIKLLGWQTTEATRHYALDRLARALREYGNEQEGVEVPCPNIIEELRYFVVNKKGRAEAAPGKHDDDVLALAIGLACEGAATEYIERYVRRELPPDLRKAERIERRSRIPYAECG